MRNFGLTTKCNCFISSLDIKDDLSSFFQFNGLTFSDSLVKKKFCLTIR